MDEEVQKVRRGAGFIFSMVNRLDATSCCVQCKLISYS